MTINVSNVVVVVVFHVLVIAILIAVLNLIFVFQNLTTIALVGSLHLIIFNVLNLAITSHMIVAYFTCLIEFDELVPFPCKKRYCYYNLLLRNFPFHDNYYHFLLL